MKVQIPSAAENERTKSDSGHHQSVHDEPESVFTLLRNECSRWAEIGVHVAPKYATAIPSVPISIETLSPNSLVSRAKGVFNVSRLVTIIGVRESINLKG